MSTMASDDSGPSDTPVTEGPAAYPTGRGLAAAGRAQAFGVVALIYVVAAAAAFVAAAALDGRHPITVALGADLAATVVVFASSMIVANSSMYDAYWSVVPPVIAIAWSRSAPDSVSAGVAARHVAVVGLVLIWAARLTLNWAAHWPGFSHEDWRYVKMRDDTAGKSPWPVVSFAGVHLFPTLQVFLAMLPLWPALATGTNGAGPLDVVAPLVTLGAIAIELVSDLQLHRFTGDPANRGKVMDTGPWKYSRHPNYFGELSFWWGLYLFGLAADASWWWTIVGPLAMTAMFVFASVPMLDKRSLARRPEFEQHMQATSALVPLPRRRPRAAAADR